MQGRKTNDEETVDSAKLDVSQKSLVFVTACRLSNERGKGSRNIGMWVKFLESCAAESATDGKTYKVIHFGDCDSEIKNFLLSKKLPILFEGYKSNWIDQDCDGYLFFSNYEGFGLAAYEASFKNRPVVVSSAFPDELVRLRKNIVRLDDDDPNFKNILKLVGRDQ